MSPICVFLALLLSSVSALRSGNRRASSPTPSSATPSPTPSYEPKPLCFPAPDQHSVSKVVATCGTLLFDFIDSFGERMNQPLHWTGNNSETGRGMVHLPQVTARQNREKTGACLVEVVDRANGDYYSAMSLRGPGLKILKDCFSQNKCGEVAIPPHGTTTLAICGTYAPNGTSLLRRPVEVVGDGETNSGAVTLD